MGPERKFRTRVVVPFLKKLKRTAVFSIQQVAIVGTPDLLLCINGSFVALELKSSKGSATKIQEYTLEKIRLSGGLAMVVSPDNWPDISETLKILSGGFND